MTNEDLIFKLSYNILSFRMNSPQKALYQYEKKWGRKFSDLTREDIIDWGNKNLVKLLDADKEVIKREEWDLEGMKGATIKQLCHSHFNTMKDYFFSNFQPLSTTAVIMLCSNKKPYSANNTIKSFYKIATRYKADFFIVSNPGVIPISYDNYYPFRWYEWNEYEETPQIKELYYEVTMRRLEEWFTHFPYKKVVSVIRPGETCQAFIDSNLPLVEKCHVFTKENIEKIHEKYLPIFKTTGLLKTRILSLSMTKGIFEEFLKG
jgi:predicted RNA-binding protein